MKERTRSQRYGPGRLHIPILAALLLAGVTTVARAADTPALDSVSGASASTTIAYTADIAAWALPDRCVSPQIIAGTQFGQVAYHRGQVMEVPSVGLTEVLAVTSANHFSGHNGITGGVDNLAMTFDRHTVLQC